MIGLTFLRHATPARWIAAVAIGATLSAAVPAAAQEADANPNVIVDDSVLERPATAAASGTRLLTPPAQPPVSRLVTSTEAAVGHATPPDAISDRTYAAVPTASIEFADLDHPDGVGATAPAAGEAPALATRSAAGASAPGAGGMLRIPFAPGSALIPESETAALDALVDSLLADYLLRVQVLAYAAGDESQASHARGVSLARALAMRDYLSAGGIGMDRMDIRALGNTAQEEPVDRVDLIPLAQ
jgi:outer membrane protein OmpA-like peptidoglycan-associated protein